jgi:Zn-dependent protease
MRDPMSWSIPLFRAFGIQVKLHLTYILVTLAMLWQVYDTTGSKGHLAEFALIWVVMLFVVVLLHEFGHCFAARRVDGEAEEILMWPLGGLAFCAVPHTPRANLITTAGGPLVNVAICVICAGAVAAAGYLPPLNIIETRQLYHPELYNWQTGINSRPYTDSPYFETEDGRHVAALKYVLEKEREGTPFPYVVPDPSKPGGLARARMIGDVYPAWVLWTARLFWMSWMLLLFNLIPAFPLDGGRFLQEILWARSGDYRSATQVACWSGIITSLVFVFLSISLNTTMLFALGLFMIIASYQQLIMLDRSGEEGGAFGYDFSKGYGGFGPDEDTPAVKPRRVGPFKRWVQARRARKLKLEVEQRAADEARLDELLDKIGRLGKESLTAEERRFMDRVSARYRNRP